jgi:hypothetical protein
MERPFDFAQGRLHGRLIGVTEVGIIKIFAKVIICTSLYFKKEIIFPAKGFNFNT